MVGEGDSPDHLKVILKRDEREMKATSHFTPATDQPDQADHDAGHAADHGEALSTTATVPLTAPVRLYSRADEPTTPPATRRWLEATLLAG